MSETAAACLAIEEDLSALIDEELAPEREAELRAHLETCDRCARRLEELCNVDLVLASLPAPEVASDLRAQLAGRIAEHERREALSAVSARREERPRQAPPPRTRRWLGRRVAALAALAAAALLAVFATLRSGEAPAPDAPQIARPAPQALPVQGPGAARRAASRRAAERGARAGARGAGASHAARSRTRSRSPRRLRPRRRAGRVAETPPAVGLEDLSEEDLAMLLVLDAVEDLDVVANLELLEDLLELEGMGGAG